MIISTIQRAVLITVASLFGGIAVESATDLRDNYGPSFEASKAVPAQEQSKPPHGGDTLGQVLYWNQVAIDASGLDHTPPAPGENRVFHEQLGPGRASRAIAIVQIAVFDAINSITGGYESYAGIPPIHAHTSVEAAIAQAAHDTLVAMFPAQAATFDELLAGDLNQLNIQTKMPGRAASKSGATRRRQFSRCGVTMVHNAPNLW